MKKVISIILSLVMLFSLLPMQTFAAEQYTDTAGNWAEGAIDRWSEYGVIEGSNGRFDPNGTLTRAQMAAILSRLLALPEAKSAGFSDVKETDWYAPYINSCYASGIMLGSDGKAQPNDPITREQAIVMLSRALGIKPIENEDLSGYTDAATVSDWAKGYVAAMAEAGIVKGTSDTTVSPKASIDRAATVTILDRAIGTYANVDGAEVTAADSGIILIAADNVKVTGAAKGATVIVSPSADGTMVNGAAVAAGTTTTAAEEKQDKPVVSGGGGGGGGGGPTPSYSDLTISADQKVADGIYKLENVTCKNVTIPESIGNGDVTLNNVTIKGKLIVQGGGKNSIHLDGCIVDTIQVDKDSSAEGVQQPRIELNNTPVETIEAVQPVIIEADQKSTVKAVEAKSDVTVKGAATKVESVTVPAAAADRGVMLTVDGAKVKTVAAEKPVTIEATVGASPIESVTAKDNVTVQGAKIETVTVPENVKTKPEIKVTTGAVSTVEAKSEIKVEGGSNTIANVKAEAPVVVNSATVVTVTVTVQVTVTVTGTSAVEVAVNTTSAVSVVTTNTNVSVSTTLDEEVNVVKKESESAEGIEVTHIHKWGSGSVTKAATCTEEGSVTYTCSGTGTCDMGNTKTETLPAKGHTADTVIPAVPATCTATGLTAGKKCSVCNTVLISQEVIPAKGHTEAVDAAVAATCTGTGLTEGKHCSVCKEVLIAQTQIDALGHKYGEASYTWAKDGNAYKCTATRICTHDASHKETETVTATYAVTTPAACETNGVGTYTASFENSAFNAQTKTEDIAALGHDWATEWSKDDTQHWHECQREGCNAKGNAANHNPGAEATETTAQTCTVCGHEIAPALGHICKNHLTAHEAVAATCTTAGNSAYWGCTCGKFYSDANAESEITANSWVISALGHNLTKTDAKSATCEENGNNAYWTCSRCNKVYSDANGTTETTVAAQTLPATGHSFATIWSHDETYHWHVCQREGCDAVNETAAHSWNEGVITTEPSATTAGVKTYTCTVCSATRIESVPAADSGIKFKYDYGRLCLSWEDTGLAGDMARLCLSRDGGKNWTNITTCSNGYALAYTIPAGEYNAAKVVPVVNDVANESAAITDLAIRFSMTEGAALPAADVAFNYNGAASQRNGLPTYDIRVSGVTENAYISVQVGKDGIPYGSTFFNANVTTASVTFGLTNLDEIVQSGEYQITEFGTPTISEDGKTASYSFAKRGDWTKCTAETPSGSPKATINAKEANVQLAWDAKEGATTYYLNGTTRATVPNAYIMYGHIINKDAACKISFTIEAETAGTRETWIEAKDIVNIIVDESKQPDVSIIGQEDGSYQFVSNNGFTGLYAFKLLDPDRNLINSNCVIAGAKTTMAAPYAGCTFAVREMSWLVKDGQESLDVNFSAFKTVGFTPYDYSGVTTEVHNEAELSEALNKGGTVVLMNDISVENTTASGGGAVTLDLNGHTITLGTNQLGFSNGKTATIVDSSEAKTGKILNASVSVQKGCSVRFEGGEYTYITSQDAEVFLGDIVAHNVQLYDSEVTVEGGTYDTAGISLTNCGNASISSANLQSNNGCAIFANNGTSVVLENCKLTGRAQVNNSTDNTTTSAVFRNVTLTGASNVIYVSGANASLSIESGSYTCSTDYGKLFYVSGGTLTISGGTFNQNPSDYLAKGSTATEKDGVWTVSSGDTPAAYTEVTTCEALLAALDNPAVTGINIARDIIVSSNYAQHTSFGVEKPVVVKSGCTLTVAGYTGTERANDMRVFNDLRICGGGSLTLEAGATLATTESNNNGSRCAGRVYVEPMCVLFDVSKGIVANNCCIYYEYNTKAETPDSSNLVVGASIPNNITFAVYEEDELRAALQDAKNTGGTDVVCDITLTKDLTLEGVLALDARLTVPSGKTLTVAEGGKLYVFYELLVNGGTLTNAGTITNFGIIDVIGGTFSNTGTVEGLPDGNDGYMSMLAIEHGSFTNSGTIKDYIDIADYFYTDKTLTTTIAEGTTVDFTSDNCSKVAVAFGNESAAAALDEDEDYEAVIVCGTNPAAELNTVELGDLTVPGGTALVLKETVFDGVNTYHNEYKISAGKTLTLARHAGMHLRGDISLDVQGTLSMGGDNWFNRMGDLTLGGKLVDSLAKLKEVLPKGGDIYLLPFAWEDQTDVSEDFDEEPGTCFETQYHLEDPVTVGSNTRLVGLGEPVAVFFDNGFTVAQNAKLKINGLNIVAVKNSTVNGTVEVYNDAQLVVQGNAVDATLTISNTGRIFVGEGESTALAIYDKYNVTSKIDNNGTIDCLGKTLFGEDQFSGVPVRRDFANLRDLICELYRRFDGMPNMASVDYDTTNEYGIADFDCVYRYPDGGSQMYNEKNPDDSDVDALGAFAWFIKNGIIPEYNAKTNPKLCPYELVTKEQAAELLNKLGNKILGTTDESYSGLSGSDYLCRTDNIPVEKEEWKTSELRQAVDALENSFASLRRVDVTSEAELLAALELPYVTEIHVIQSMTILGTPDTSDTHFAGCFYLNNEGRNGNLNIYIHGVATLTVGKAGHTTKLDIGEGVNVTLIQIEKNHAKVEVSKDSCVNVFGGLDVRSDNWDYEEYFTGNINFYPDVMEFGKRLSERVEAYGLVAMSVNERTANFERAADWPTPDKEPDNARRNGFEFLVKNGGVVPVTEGEGKVWRPYDKIRYGEAMKILTNVYKAIDNDATGLPTSVALGDEHWTPQNTDCISDNDVDELLDKFVAELPRIDDSTTESFIVVKDQNQVISNKSFYNPITITCDKTKTNDSFGGDIKFNNCAFPEGATVKMTGGVGYNVRLNDNCTGSFTVDAENGVIGQENTGVNFFGMNGVTINGLTISGNITNVKDNDFNVNVRYDEDGEEDGVKSYIPTLEIDNLTKETVKVTGSYEGKLRLAGNLDVEGVTLSGDNSRIELSNQCDSEIALGSNNILVNNDCGGGYVFTGTAGSKVIVRDQNQNAQITVNGVSLGTPHVFGRGNHTIFFPLASTNGISFTVEQGHWDNEKQCAEGWTELEYELGQQTGKLHLSGKQNMPWIDDPYQVRVTVEVTGGCTVVYDTMMWKPVQMDEFVEELNKRFSGKDYTLNSLGVTKTEGNLTFGACKTAFATILAEYGKTETVNMRTIINDSNYWNELEKWTGEYQEAQNSGKQDWINDVKNRNPDNWTRRWNDLNDMLDKLTAALNTENESNQ